MNKFQSSYQGLRKKYGHPKDQWIVWCKRPKTEKEKERVMIGAILTQQTNWNNVSQAMDNLEKANIRTLKDIAQFKDKKKEIARLVRPSGFYREKTKYLFNLIEFFEENLEAFEHITKESLPVLREKLIAVKGLGKETTDSILLYAFEKPVFVIDDYTKRFLKRKKMSRRFSYDYLQELFHKNLRKDYRLYQDFHALIVIEEQHYAKSQLYK